MGRTSIFELDVWADHEQRVREVFVCALVALARQPSLPVVEVDLNRRLALLARSENHRLLREGRGCTSPVLLDVQNQPGLSDITRASWEDKRPDFTCGFSDGQAGVDLFLVVEAKRIGEPSSPGWILNANYVTNGVNRFRDPDWRYGNETLSGLMVGYLQTSTMAKARHEVNGHTDAHGLARLKAVRGTRGSPVVQLGHSFARPFRCTPFGLIHLWVDVRNNQLLPAS